MSSAFSCLWLSLGMVSAFVGWVGLFAGVGWLALFVVAFVDRLLSQSKFHRALFGFWLSLRKLLRVVAVCVGGRWRFLQGGCCWFLGWLLLALRWR